jgi:glycosyltransferase involved in cell wall biosynthesis
MKALDVLLLPSHREPFGAVVGESMAMGTPAIVSTPSGSSELIEDRANGRVLAWPDPDLWADAVLEIAKNQAAMKAMGRAARSAVSGLTDAAHAERSDESTSAHWLGGLAPWPLAAGCPDWP